MKLSLFVPCLIKETKPSCNTLVTVCTFVFSWAVIKNCCQGIVISIQVINRSDVFFAKMELESEFSLSKKLNDKRNTEPVRCLYDHTNDRMH